LGGRDKLALSEGDAAKVDELVAQMEANRDLLGAPK
jgi:hypothetical protein